MIVAQTRAFCNSCNSWHESELVREENTICGIVRCPKGDLKYEMSSNAEMFLALRKKSSTDLRDNNVLTGMRYVLNYISITNACNLSCTVCGASAKTNSKNAVYLSVEEICRRAEEVRHQGGQLLHLFGGEPTIHPDVLEIVKRISGMGFSVGIVTNGYMLGTNDQLAYKLKEMGLTRICLQFDSLNTEVLEKLGRNYLKEKKRAIENSFRAGLSIGLNCTVTKYNLDEVADLLAHGLDLGISVKNMTFASAAPMGRYKLALQDSADREQVITSLLRAGGRYGFDIDDVLPLPAYLPWGIQTHPDCGAHILFVRTPRGVKPLNKLIDLLSVYRKMGRSRMRKSLLSKYLIPAFFLIISVRPGRLLESLGIALGLLLSKRKYSLVNVGISNYKGAMFLDEQRITRCASAFYTSTGPVKGCLHFFSDKSCIGSKEYEELHGSC